MKSLFKLCASALCLMAFSPIGAQTDVEEEGVAAAPDQSIPETPVVLAGQTIQGRVLDVMSGKTFTMNTPDNQVIEVWLAEIAAPAYGQRHWAASTQALADKIIGNEVTILAISQRDLEKGSMQLISQVYLGDRWINREMVAEGMAWHSPEYLQSDELSAAEYQAKEMQLGIWAE